MDKSHIPHLIQKLSHDPGLPLPSPTPSYWQFPPHPISTHQSPILPSSTDILIIGSGITGTSTAFHLLSSSSSIDDNNSNIKVTVLEAREATSGATGRNGGHIKETPWESYDEFVEMFGKREAVKLVRFRMAHLSALVDVGAKVDLGGGDDGEGEGGAQARVVQGVDAFFDKEGWGDAKKRLERWLVDFEDQRGLWEVYEGREAQDRFGMPTVQGCITGPAGAIWPYRLITPLLSNLLKTYGNRFSLETNTPVTSISQSSSDDPSHLSFTVETPRGSIKAKHIIHCTNGYAGHLLPALRGHIFPLRGQMTVQSAPRKLVANNINNNDNSNDSASSSPSSLESLKDRPEQSWILHWPRGFDYITQNPHGSRELYFGGGFFRDAKGTASDLGTTDDSVHTDGALTLLETAGRRAFGGDERKEEQEEQEMGGMITHKWTGIMGYTTNVLPMVGKLDVGITGRHLSSTPIATSSSKRGSEWLAAGFCGHGMAYCWLTGKALAEMVLHNDETVVDKWFPRLPFAVTKERLGRSDLGSMLEGLLFDDEGGAKLKL